MARPFCNRRIALLWRRAIQFGQQTRRAEEGAALTNLVLSTAEAVSPRPGCRREHHFDQRQLHVKSKRPRDHCDTPARRSCASRPALSATDYTASEQWNFKTATAGGRDSGHRRRIMIVTNGPGHRTQEGVGTNTTLYATISTNIPLSIVGTANHGTQPSGKFATAAETILGYVATNAFSSQYDFLAQLTTTDNTPTTFTSRGKQFSRAALCYVVGWNFDQFRQLRQGATFKMFPAPSRSSLRATIGGAEDDAASNAGRHRQQSGPRARRGHTGKTALVRLRTLYYAP